MKSAKATLLTLFGMSIMTLSFPTYSAQVINDNLMIKGRECVGTDCLNNETMVHDAIRLKSNTQRIHFEDTSVGSFPGNNWRFLINDLNEFGTNYFGIEDATAGRVPFRIDAGAPNAALRIGSTGRIGMGTSLPQRNLHIVSNNPALRLESVNLSSPTIWDFDVGLSSLRFKTSQGAIFALSNDAPHSSFKMNSNGDVGMGTLVPFSSLHIRRNDGSAQLLVEEIINNTAPRTLLQLKNNGETRLSLKDTSSGVGWDIGNTSSGLKFSVQNSGVEQMVLSNNGNLAIAGTLTVVSDINQKTAIETIHTTDILDKLNRLTINRWEYKDARGEKHIGPMAQDFYALFGLGGDEKGISTLDAAGVTIAAVQALTTENTSLKAAYRGLLSAHWELRQTLEEMQAELQAQRENTQRVETLINQIYQEQKGQLLITVLK